MKLYLIKKQILISLIITAAAVFIGSQGPFGLSRATMIKIVFYSSLFGSVVTFLVFRKRNLLILYKNLRVDLLRILILGNLLYIAVLFLPVLFFFGD